MKIETAISVMPASLRPWAQRSLPAAAWQDQETDIFTHLYTDQSFNISITWPFQIEHLKPQLVECQTSRRAIDTDHRGLREPGSHLHLGEEIDQLTFIEIQLKLQVSRILEDIRTVDECYGPWIAEQDPELAKAMTQAATALDRFISSHETSRDLP